MLIHCISDLHLAPTTPALNQLFAHLLHEWCGRIDALYILGDLFEYWVGDDDDSSFIAESLAAMRSFSAHTPLWVMHGNRDFLLSAEFARRSGANLIADPTVLNVGQARYLLSHGDALCTDDSEYQAFRLQVRNTQWQETFLTQPLVVRHALARQARQESRADPMGQTAISDVSESAVLALLEEYDWPTLIHGHTHRPACHEHRVGEHRALRWVIADWHDQQGGVVRIDSQGVTAHPLHCEIKEQEGL